MSERDWGVRSWRGAGPGCLEDTGAKWKPKQPFCDREEMGGFKVRTTLLSRKVDFFLLPQ